MTREEALARLEGTWSFDVVRDQVLVRDPKLLSAVAEVRREWAGGERRPVAVSPSSAVGASRD